MLDVLSRFPDQCCDADQYLAFGRACALEGNCYDNLRPIGAIFWFSFPFRFDVDPVVWFFAAHTLLLLLSIVLSVFAVRVWFAAHHGFIMGRMQLGLLTGGSLIIHAVFFWPVARYPLSDLPANVLLLLGVWLLMLSASRTRVAFLCVALAGLSLGAAVIMRTFFLVPVMVVLGIAILGALIFRQKTAILLVTALLPIGCQYAATWQHQHQFSFLDEKTSAYWRDFHLTNSAIGYDVLLPRNGFFWYTSCLPGSDLVSAIQDRDSKSLLCLLGQRTNYYLGSYMTNNYEWAQGVNPNWSDPLSPPYRSSVTQPGVWRFTNLKRIDDAAPGINGSSRASLLLPLDVKNYSEMVQSIHLDGSPFPYGLGTWMWSEHGTRPVVMQVRQHATGNVVATTTIQLTPEASVKSLDNIFIHAAGDYDLVIGLPALEKTSLSPGGVLLWEDLDLRWYMAASKHPGFRFWSRSLLGVNLLAMLAALYIFIKGDRWRNADTILSSTLPLLLMAMSFGLCLLVIPEQRFMIAVLVFIWIMAVATLVNCSMLIKEEPA